MSLIESRMPAEPIALFRRWYRQAERAGAPQPEAMTLATAGRDRTPSARMVLFKGIEGVDFLFYSNYESRKGRDLALNRKDALVIYWSVTRHQVSVSCAVLRLSRAATLGHYQSRPRGAQLSSLASRHRRVVE